MYRIGKITDPLQTLNIHVWVFITHIDEKKGVS